MFVLRIKRFMLEEQDNHLSCVGHFVDLDKQHE